MGIASSENTKSSCGLPNDIEHALVPGEWHTYAISGTQRHTILAQYHVGGLNLYPPYRLGQWITDFLEYYRERRAIERRSFPRSRKLGA